MRHLFLVFLCAVRFAQFFTNKQATPAFGSMHFLSPLHSPSMIPSLSTCTLMGPITFLRTQTPGPHEDPPTHPSHLFLTKWVTGAVRIAPETAAPLLQHLRGVTDGRAWDNPANHRERGERCLQRQVQVRHTLRALQAPAQCTHRPVQVQCTQPAQARHTHRQVQEKRPLKAQAQCTPPRAQEPRKTLREPRCTARAQVQHCRHRRKKLKVGRWRHRPGRQCAATYLLLATAVKKGCDACNSS